jgi:hypothetical protein
MVKNSQPKLQELIINTQPYNLTSLQAAAIITAIDDPYAPARQLSTAIETNYSIKVYTQGMGGRANRRVRNLVHSKLRDFVQDRGPRG